MSCSSQSPTMGPAFHMKGWTASSNRPAPACVDKPGPPIRRNDPRLLGTLIIAVVLIEALVSSCVFHVDPLAVAKNPGVALQELLTLPLEEPIGELERILIAQALTRAAGNKSEAARLLGIHRQTLYTKLKELEISDSAQEDF